jgi:hypothetical protein
MTSPDRGGHFPCFRHTMQRISSAMPAISSVRPATKISNFSGHTGTPAGLLALDSRIRVASNE